MDFTAHLPNRDFDLRMRFQKGKIASFFQSRHTPPELLAERTRLLNESPTRYAAFDEEGEAILEEVIELASSLAPVSPSSFDGLPPFEKCRALGKLWEADFLLMKPDAEGTFRLCGGCVCFPSHWDLGEKMRLPMAAIHQAVPGLNEALGRQINGFLQKIKPGISWERGNWGLSRSPERNLHPSLDLPRLDHSVSLKEVWWRLEEQSLVALPNSGGILFGIKLVIRPLTEIKKNEDARLGLIRALETMPDEMAAYKGILRARQRLLDLLQADGDPSRFWPRS